MISAAMISGAGRLAESSSASSFSQKMSRLTLSRLRQVFVGERFETLALLAAVAVLRIVAGNEVIQVGALEGIFLEREVLVCAQIVNPELLCPRLFLGGLAVEEKDVGLHALGVENAGGQAQQCVDIGLLEQFAADGFAGAAFKEHVVRQHDGRAAMLS